MSRQIVTHEDIVAVASRGVLRVAADALLTERAEEAAQELGVSIDRSSGPAPASRAGVGATRADAGAGSPGGPAAPLTRPSPPAAPVASPGGASRPASHPPRAAGVAEPDCGLNRVIVTAVGRNRPGVLGELTTLIGRERGDIQEISQKVHGGYFNLVLIVDVSACPGSTQQFKATLEAASRPDDYRVFVQHQKVFEAMHRV